MRAIYRAPERRQGLLSRPIFGALGLRPVAAQHTEAEAKLLRDVARGRHRLVEIGVAEGASAAELAEVMNPVGTLTLIDPYALRTFRSFSFAAVAAHRLVRSRARGDVRWIEKFSTDAAKGWTDPIDFLFIDGDHRYECAIQDWRDWTPHVTSSGVVALHDASLDAPWTSSEDGPVRVRNEIVAEGEWEVFDKCDSLVVLRRTRGPNKG